jgi:hypothetical protein
LIFYPFTSAQLCRRLGRDDEGILISNTFGPKCPIACNSMPHPGIPALMISSFGVARLKCRKL